jgi:hypothetical protein
MSPNWFGHVRATARNGAKVKLIHRVPLNARKSLLAAINRFNVKTCTLRWPASGLQGIHDPYSTLILKFPAAATGIIWRRRACPPTLVMGSLMRTVVSTEFKIFTFREVQSSLAVAAECDCPSTERFFEQAKLKPMLHAAHRDTPSAGCSTLRTLIMVLS